MSIPKSHLKQRLAVSAILVPIMLIVIYFSDIPFFKPLFGLCVAAIISTALWEFYRLAEYKGLDPTMSIGIVGSIGYLYGIYLNALEPGLDLLPLFALGLTFLFSFAYYFFTGTHPLTNLAVTFFGVSYLTVPLGTLISIAFLPHVMGKWWLLYLFCVTKMNDTGSFFIGKQFGRNKMAPYISPKKTWEGAIAGLFIGCLTSVVFYYFFQDFLSGFKLSEAILLGFILSIMAQVGDLSESLLKRDAGVKDSNQLPGLGGMMDILDALIFASPVLYFYLKLRSSL